MNLPDFFYQAIQGIFPGDILVTGVLLFIGFAILMFKARIPQSMSYVLGIMILYVFWIGIGQPFDALAMVAFGIGGIMILLMLFSFTRK